MEKTSNSGIAKDAVHSITGILNLSLYDKKNKLLHKQSEQNLIVMTGYHTVAKALAGVPNSHIVKIAIGTNSTPEQENDMAITDSLLFDVEKIEYPKPGIVRFHFKIGYLDAIGMAIREFGLITAGSKLFSRKTRELIEKTEDFRIAGYWDIVICENFDPEVYFLTLDGESSVDLELDAEGGSKTCILNSSHPWMASMENLQFANVSPSSGPAGDGQEITLSAIANTGNGRSEFVELDNEIGQCARANIHQPEANKYTLTVDSQNDSPVETFEHYAGATLFVPVAPYKPGFDFIGWEWSVNDTIVQPGTPLTMPADDAGLIAQYIETPPIQAAYITIDNEPNLSAKVGAEGDTLTLTLDSSSEWEITDAFAFGTVLPASGPAGNDQQITVTIDANTGVERSDTIVFANAEGEYCQLNINQSVKSYQVSYNSAGGSAVSGSPFTVQTGQSHTVAAAPTRSGYSFTGWKRNDTGAIVQPGNTFAMPANDVSLTAQWTEIILSYQVAYDSAGGSAVSGSPFTVQTGQSHTVAAAPTRSGYNFTGWERNDTGAIVQPGNTFAMPANDVSLTAQWTEIVVNKYIVTYDSDGGTTPPEDTDQYSAGDTVTIKSYS